VRLADAEDLWLACVCQAPRYADNSLVDPDHLGLRARGILDKIREVVAEGWPIVTAEQLRSRNAPELRTIPQRIEAVDAASTIEAAEKALVEAWATDQMRGIYATAAEICVEQGRGAAAIWEAKQRDRLSDLSAGVHWVTPAEVAKDVIAQYRAQLRGDQSDRISSSFGELDSAVRFWQPGGMTVVGGWTGQGKSTLTAQILTGMGLRGVPTAMIQLEDRASVTTKRQLAMVVDELAAVQRLSNDTPTELDLDMFERVAESVLAQLPMHLVHGQGWSVAQACHAAQDAIRRFGAKVVAVDYLQCFRSDPSSRANRTEVLGDAAAALKSTVTRLGGHLLLCSQLVRPEGRDARTARPSMYMLKNSGDIENATDYALLVHRPERGDDGPTEKARIYVDKAKDGAVGFIDLGWDSIRNMFTLV